MRFFILASDPVILLRRGPGPEDQIRGDRHPIACGPAVLPVATQVIGDRLQAAIGGRDIGGAVNATAAKPRPAVLCDGQLLDFRQQQGLGEGDILFGGRHWVAVSAPHRRIPCCQQWLFTRRDLWALLERRIKSGHARGSVFRIWRANSRHSSSWDSGSPRAAETPIPRNIPILINHITCESYDINFIISRPWICKNSVPLS